MKKKILYLLLAIFLLLPFCVDASDVVVTNVEVVDNGSINESTKNSNITSRQIGFNNFDQGVTYKVTVKNNANYSVGFENTSIDNPNGQIRTSLIGADNLFIKGGQTGSFNIKVYTGSAKDYQTLYLEASHDIKVNVNFEKYNVVKDPSIDDLLNYISQATKKYIEKNPIASDKNNVEIKFKDLVDGGYFAENVCITKYCGIENNVIVISKSNDNTAYSANVLESDGTTSHKIDFTIADNNAASDNGNNANQTSSENLSDVSIANTSDNVIKYLAILVIGASVIGVFVYYKKHKVTNKLKYAICVTIVAVIELSAFAVVYSFGVNDYETVSLEFNVAYNNDYILKSAVDDTYADNNNSSDLLYYTSTTQSAFEQFFAPISITDNTTEIYKNLLNTYYYKVNKITVESNTKIENIVPAEGTVKWDMSSGNTGTIYGYLTKNGSGYEWHIVSDQQIYANPQSSRLFSCLMTSEIDVSGLNTRFVTNFNYMFYNVGPTATYTTDDGQTLNSTITVKGIDKFDTYNGTNFYGMFSNFAYNVLGKVDIGSLGELDSSSELNNEYIAAGNDSQALATYCSKIAKTTEYWDVSNGINFSQMFAYFAYSSTEVANIGTLKNWNTSSATHMTSMFTDFNFNNPDTVTLNLTCWNVSNVTNMNNIFHGVGHYTANNVSIGKLNNWDVSKLRNLWQGFYGYGSGVVSNDVTIGDLSSWGDKLKYEGITLGRAFGGFAENTTGKVDIGDISNWTVKTGSGVMGLQQMFISFGKNSSDLSIYKEVETKYGTVYRISLNGFDTSLSTSFDNVFAETGQQFCSNHVCEIDIYSWDATKIYQIQNMFKDSNVTHIWANFALSDEWQNNKKYSTGIKMSVFAGCPNLVAVKENADGTITEGTKATDTSSYTLARQDTAVYDESGNLLSGTPGLFSTKYTSSN